MRRRTMLLTVTALTSLAYCSEGPPECRGFCSTDATTGPPDVVEDPPLGFADALGFVAPDAAIDAADATADANDASDDAEEDAAPE